MTLTLLQQVRGVTRPGLDRAGHHRRRAKSAWPGILLVLAAACGSQASDAPVSAPAPAPGAPVTGREITMTRDQIQHAGVHWEAVRAVSTAEVVELPGQLAPNEDRTARLGAPARARVVAVHVRIGDRVTAGQPLVTLQSEQGAAARAEHAKAVAELQARQAAAAYAATALGRAERLLELKAASRQDVERARVEKNQADAAVTQGEADVERTRTALEQLGVDVRTSDLILRASLPGIVLSRDVVPGTVVEAGTALLMVTDPATLWLDIAATERVAPALKRGSRVRFSVSQLGPSTFEAVVEDVGGALDPATRTLPVHAVVQNATGALRPAMFATVTLTLGEPRPGVAVPEDAVQLLDERPVVFVARPDPTGGARFERRDVEVGARTDNQIHVVGGLAPGDVVVTGGAFAVKSEFARSRMPAG
jgi:cobalt-zinc-cadmium efflux system membrane fusion protein